MAEPFPPERRVYRLNTARILLPLLLLVPVYIFVLAAVFVHPAFAIGAVPWLPLAYWVFRIGVFVSADGVVVRNVLNSRRIPWGEIERFDWAMGKYVPIGGIYLRDGSFVRAFALNPPYDPARRKNPVVQELLDRLNGELDRARAARVPSGEPSPGADAPDTHQLELDQ